MKLMIPCRCCKQTGMVELNGAHADTYWELAKFKGETTGAALGRLMGVPATAMNNRLVYLERYGLAVSRRYGRERFFRAVKR